MYDNIILVPYRNRTRQFNYLIDNIVPLFEENLPNSKVVIVEQNGNELFNKGKLLNVVINEYQYKTKYFITNDIDTYPTKLLINEKYNAIVDDDEILSIFSAVDTLGGIIKISNENYFKINGYPNDCWGWGGEDTALLRRAEFFNIKINRFLTPKADNSQIKEYLERIDDVQDRVIKNNTKHIYRHSRRFKSFTKDKKQKHILSSGLNNIQYEITERINIGNIVEHIKVSI